MRSLGLKLELVALFLRVYHGGNRNRVLDGDIAHLTVLLQAAKSTPASLLRAVFDFKIFISICFFLSPRTEEWLRVRIATFKSAESVFSHSVLFILISAIER